MRRIALALAAAMALVTPVLAPAETSPTYDLKSGSPRMLTATTTSLSSGPGASTFGQFVTLIADVTPGAATGSVEFFLGATSLGTASLAGGSAKLSVSNLPVGSNSLQANYLGDATYDPSTSSSIVHVVDPAPSETPPVYISQWGAGQFSQPTGVAVDASGDNYVVSIGANAVYKFNGIGASLTLWGSGGSGNGQFSGPAGVATDKNGSVYVADDGNHRIQKFSSSGAYLAQFGSSPQLSRPWSVAVDGAGNLYVLDYSNARIVKYNSGGALVTQWGTGGSGNGQFSQPTGIALDAAGNVYVADHANHRVQKFTSTGTYLTQWGSQGTGIGQFRYPFGVAVDPSGNVYVTDEVNTRVQKFTSGGAYLTQWGTGGGGNGQFGNVTGIAVDPGGNVYVADRGNNRIQEFGGLHRIESVADVGNDQGRQVRVRFVSTSLDYVGAAGPATVVRYDVFRRIDPSLVMQAPSLEPFRSEVAPDVAQLDGWDAVGSVSAYGDAIYSVAVSTLSDSNSSGMHRAVFFVRATTGTIGTYYDSPPDSGYSLDNLPPAPPAPFIGAYGGGATALHWGITSELDFWIYRLYRGASADFVPGPGNLVVSKTDTGYVDTGPAGRYYKLSAVDRNGNESRYALLAPSGTSAVPDEELPRSLWLAAPRPNPARSETMFRIGLPHQTFVSLAVYGIDGRRIRELVGKLMPAGEHALRWDLLGEDGRRPAASGLYFVRLNAGGAIRSERVVVAR